MFHLWNDAGGRSGAAKRFRCAVIFAGLLVVMRAYAAKPDCQMKESEDCINTLSAERFQIALKESKEIDPKNTSIVYLVLNHETLKWSVYHSKPHKPKPIVTKDEMNALLGPDGNPRVVRSGNEKLVLIVVQTNPFLYSYEGTVSPSQYSPDAAAMQAALSAIGSANLFLVAGIDQTHKTLAEEKISPEEQEAQKRIDIKIRALTALHALDKLVAERDLVQSYVRRLETSGDDKTLQPRLKCVSEVAKDGLAALDEFEWIAGNLPKPYSCYRIWAPLVRLTVLTEIKKEDLATARAEMLEMDAQSDHRCEEVVNDAFCVLEKLEKTVDKKPDPPSSNHKEQPSDHEKQQKILSDIKENWRVRIALISDSVLSAKKDLLAAAAQLEAFVQLGRTRALLPQTEGDLTWPLAGRVVVVAPPFPSQTWLQDNPGTLSIKPDTSVYPECPRLKPTGVDKKFLLVSHREPFLGYGFGLAAFKSIVDPTFGAVNTSTTPPPTGSNPQSLMIARTAEDSRWGTIVAMVFLRARPLLCRNAQPKPVEPGLEFGFGLNSLKKTSLFLGASFEFHRFVRLGIGTTCQVINRLAEGLTEGDPVVAITDVRTQPKWKWRLYVGLTFALDALPLFSSSK